MRVCLICYRGNPFCGGQGIYVSNLSRALAGLGHEVTVMVGPPYPDPMPWARVIKLPNYMFWGQKIHEVLRGHGLAWAASPMDLYEFIATRAGYLSELLAFSLRAAGKIREAAGDKPFDVIHDVETLGYGLMLIKAHGAPVVSTVHHPLTKDLIAMLGLSKSLRHRWFNVVFYPLLMQGLMARLVDGMITSSTVGVTELQAAFKVKEQRIHLVYTGVDTNVFAPNPEIKRELYEILFVGNAEDRRKGVRYLLQALQTLPSHVHLTIVDQGRPNKTYAPHLVEHWGLTDRVTFTGRLTFDELLHKYLTATVLVMPSLFEGFGLPAAEGMATATPVIVSRAGSLPEVVGADEEGGLMVPPQDVEALATALRKIIDDPAFAHDLGHRGRARAVRLFSWEKTAEDTAKLYESLIAAKKAPVRARPF